MPSWLSLRNARESSVIIVSQRLTLRILLGIWDSLIDKILYIFERSAAFSLQTKAVKEVTDLWSISDKVVAITEPKRTKGRKDFHRRLILIASVTT